MKKSTFLRSLLTLLVMAVWGTSAMAQTVVFEDNFDDLTSGSNTSTNGSSVEITSRDNYSKLSKVYSAKGAIKLGSGSATGSLTTKAIDLSSNGGNYTLSFDVKGWTKLEGKIKVSTSDGNQQTVTYSAVMANSFETIELEMTGGTANTTITLATTAKRAFIDNIIITQEEGEGGGSTTPKQDQTLTFSGTTFTIEEGESFTAPTLTGAMTTVTYSSSKATVATVNENTGEVTIKGAGTTIITATAAANEEYNSASASYTLTVNPNIAGVSLPYMLETKIGDENFGGKANLPSSATQKGLGSDYAAGQNYNNRLKFDDTGDYLVFKLADSPATLSYYLYSGTNDNMPDGVFTVETSADGENYEALKDYNTEEIFVDGNNTLNEIHLSLNADVRYIRWTYTQKVKGNIGLGSIYITKQGAATTMPLTISAAKYATFFSDKAIVMPEGVSGSIVTIDGAQANLTEQYVAGDIVPANTPLMLSAEQGTYDAPFTAATNTSNAANLLKGALTNDVITAPAGSLLYIFANDSESGLGFYWQKNSNNGQQVQNMAGKAYLQVPTTSAVKGFRLNLGDTTGITAVESTLGNAPVYTLSGVRVNGSLNNLPAGIYIVGGKKVYVK